MIDLRKRKWVILSFRTVWFEGLDHDIEFGIALSNVWFVF